MRCYKRLSNSEPIDRLRNDKLFEATFKHALKRKDSVADYGLNRKAADLETPSDGYDVISSKICPNFGTLELVKGVGKV